MQLKTIIQRRSLSETSRLSMSDLFGLRINSKLFKDDCGSNQRNRTCGEPCHILSNVFLEVDMFLPLVQLLPCLFNLLTSDFPSLLENFQLQRNQIRSFMDNIKL